MTTIIQFMSSYPLLFNIISNIIPLRLYVPRGLLRFLHQNPVYLSVFPHIWPMLPSWFDQHSNLLRMQMGVTEEHMKTCGAWLVFSWQFVSFFNPFNYKLVFLATWSWCFLMGCIWRCVFVFLAHYYKHRNSQDVRQHCMISVYRLELKNISLLLPAILDASIRGAPASSCKYRDGSRVF